MQVSPIDLSHARAMARRGSDAVIVECAHPRWQSQSILGWLDAEGVVFEMVEATVDASGSDEESETGGDHKSEPIPRLVLHHRDGAEETVG